MAALHEPVISRDDRVDAMIVDLLNAEDSTTDAVCSLLAVITALAMRMSPTRRQAMVEVLRTTRAPSRNDNVRIEKVFEP